MDDNNYDRLMPGYLASLEVTNRSELIERIQQIVNMLEKYMNDKVSWNTSEMTENNGMECTCYKWVLLEMINYLNIPNASIIISII